jgi:hypothetical protein
MPGGGSVGVPGVAGGISGGSIGIGTFDRRLRLRCSFRCSNDDNACDLAMFLAVSFLRIPRYCGV